MVIDSRLYLFWPVFFEKQIAGVDVLSNSAMQDAKETNIEYDEYLDYTLAVGLSPLVVPQLKTITVGGALTGWVSSRPRSAAASCTNRCGVRRADRHG